jgi:hypothetical protein
VIKEEKIAAGLPFMKNIKVLISIMTSPVILKEDRLAGAGLAGNSLFSSSDRSWEMKDRINLTPMFIRPPEDLAEMRSRPLAAIVSGEFPSYFAGRPVPEKPAPQGADSLLSGPAGEVGAAPGSPEGIEGRLEKLNKGQPGKLVVFGTAQLLKNNVLDEAGQSTNATFIMNLLDHLNDRDEYAAMRSKMQRYNPLRETSGAVKTFVKSFNIAGLPVITALFGVAVWLKRKSRKRAIEMMFRK